LRINKYKEKLNCTPLLSGQKPFCQTVPLLLSVTWQQNVTEYWWEGSASTAILPTCSTDIMGQHHKIGGITFRVVLINYNSGIVLTRGILYQKK